MTWYEYTWEKYDYKLFLLFLAAHSFVINHAFFFKAFSPPEYKNDTDSL